MKKIVCLILLAFNNFCFSAGELFVVSERHDFKDADKLSHETFKRFVSPEHPHHSWDMTSQDWEEVKAGKNIAIVIHGYNTDYEKAIKYFKDVRKRSAALYDTIICYLWPSGDEFWEYFEADDRVEGKELPKRLAILINELALSTHPVDVIAHSMGCKLLLETLSKEPIGSVGNLFLMAPAVNKDSLSTKILQIAQEIFVFYSHHDEVLTWAYPILEWHQALGADEDNKKSPHLHLIDSSSHIKNHTDYATSGFIFSTIASALAQ
ncbi:MAG: alpha/beta hydrolase [Simkaniaceae bacterium]